LVFSTGFSSSLSGFNAAWDMLALLIGSFDFASFLGSSFGAGFSSMGAEIYSLSAAPAKLSIVYLFLSF
jgi:hypothetical protein